jgi:hypothetical protein
MEDIAISKLLSTYHKPLCLTANVISSSRYWETHGIIRTILRMWYLRLAYFLGVSPATLVKRYYQKN